MHRPAAPTFRLFSGRRRGLGVFPLKSVNCINFALLACAALLFATRAEARDSLGIFSNWAAFRDPATPRCYAIAMAQPSTLQREFQPYADVGTWPRRQVRGQVHFRLSRRIAPRTTITLNLSGQRFALVGGGSDAWAADKRMDAAIVAAMRSASEMTVSARDTNGRGFSNTWRLAGAATAMDAATIGCARLR
jgi:hypothetical protein